MQDALPAGWDCHVHVFEGGFAAAGAHYQPVARSLADIEALAATQGCGHLVLVQPSVYGADNALLLKALRTQPGRHRGVVVLAGNEDDATLAAMHGHGVRGVRFNLVSPVGTVREEVPALLSRRAAGLRQRGWHVQCYVQPQDLRLLLSLQAACGLTFVLDHLAGLTPAHAGDHASWEALRALADTGAWIKLSGWYRLQAAAPYGALDAIVQRVAELFGDRMVWGSDWPHTSFAPQALPAYGSVWQPVVRVLGPERAQVVRAAGARLYSFPS
jgi:predicted TIM-barrel fold metal-dependent hydrolase